MILLCYSKKILFLNKLGIRTRKQNYSELFLHRFTSEMKEFDDNHKQYLKQQAQEYIGWEPEEYSRQIISNYVNEENFVELEKAFGKRIGFGTAGLRQSMAPGYSKMSHLVVLQTAQGIANYLDEVYHEDGKSRGVVIGYDHRALGIYSSRSFAYLSACIFMSRGYKVFLSRDMCATPLVPYIVDEVEAVLGIMVTASHNPKQDDGYKVYWENGAQLNAPYDRYVSESIMKCLEPWSQYNYKDEEEIFNNQLCIDNFTYMTDSYFHSIKNTLTIPTLSKEFVPAVVYTAMHGLGGNYINTIIDLFNLPRLVYVPTQCDPDPDFPTVSFPNPEEKGALEIAMRYADSIGVHLIMANDPDVDRFTIAEQVDGIWHQFSGDEIGTIFGYLLMAHIKNENPDSLKSYAFISSTVSGHMLKAIAEKEGMKFEECLTGFKWIGNTCIKLKKEGYSQLLGYEQAIGFALGDDKKDKDGISALVYMYQCLIQLYQQGYTLKELLNHIYKEYGYNITRNSYIMSPNSEYTERVFQKFRNNGDYVFKIGNFVVRSIRDLTTGYDSSTEDHKPLLPVDPTIHMITLTFEPNSMVTIRTSGTEPKIKLYLEVQTNSIDEANIILDQLEEALSEFIQMI